MNNLKLEKLINNIKPVTIEQNPTTSEIENDITIEELEYSNKKLQKLSLSEMTRIESNNSDSKKIKTNNLNDKIEIMEDNIQKSYIDTSLKTQQINKNDGLSNSNQNNVNEQDISNNNLQKFKNVQLSKNQLKNINSEKKLLSDEEDNENKLNNSQTFDNQNDELLKNVSLDQSHDQKNNQDKNNNNNEIINTKLQKSIKTDFNIDDMIGQEELFINIIKQNEISEYQNKDIIQKDLTEIICPQSYDCYKEQIIQRTKGILEYSFKIFNENENHKTQTLFATKNKLKNVSYFNIKIQMNNSQTYDLFKLKSDKLKQKQTLYDMGNSPQKSSDNYREHLIGIKFKLHKSCESNPNPFKVYLPYVQDKLRVIFKPKDTVEDTCENLITTLDQDSKIILETKKLKYNDKYKQQYHQFDGKVNCKSVKNCKLIIESFEDQEVFQFGKMNKDSYHMALKFPLSLIQAFSIALTLLDK